MTERDWYLARLKGQGTATPKPRLLAGEIVAEVKRMRPHWEFRS